MFLESGRDILMSLSFSPECLFVCLLKTRPSSMAVNLPWDFAIDHDQSRLPSLSLSLDPSKERYQIFAVSTGRFSIGRCTRKRRVSKMFYGKTEWRHSCFKCNLQRLCSSEMLRLQVLKVWLIMRKILYSWPQRSVALSIADLIININLLLYNIFCYWTTIAWFT